MNHSNSASRTRRLTMVAMMAVIIAACSWITIPSTVPFTMQTFAVFCALLILGGQEGTAAIALYIVLGGIGLPVFSGFRGGLAHLMGPTGGYIAGFLISGLIYIIFEKKIANSIKLKAVVLVVGLAACYALGTIWFGIVMSNAGTPYGTGAILGMCVIPYILPDLGKLALAIYVSGRVKRAIH